MLQGMYTGLVLHPWAAQSVLWETWCWERLLLDLTNLVFQRRTWLIAQARQEDTAWNKNLQVSSLPPRLRCFITLGSSCAIWQPLIPTTLQVTGLRVKQPQTHAVTEQSCLHCHFTLLVLLGRDPRGTLHTELPFREVCVSPFPGWGRDNY